MALACASNANAGEDYELVELYGTSGVTENGSVDDGWMPGRPNPTEGIDPLTGVSFDTQDEVRISRGRISIGDTNYYLRDITLPDVNILLSHYFSPQFTEDPGLFPLHDSIMGPRAKALLARVRNLQTTKLFVQPNPTFAEAKLLLPIDDHLLLISYGTVWFEENVYGQATATVSVMRPLGPGLVFTEADIRDDLLGEGLVFTEEEVLAALEADEEVTDPDALEFSEQDIRDFIEAENEDLLKILGCAARLWPCPYDLDANLVRDWMQVMDDPAEILSEIALERRTAQASK